MSNAMIATSVIRFVSLTLFWSVFFVSWAEGGCASDIRQVALKYVIDGDSLAVFLDGATVQVRLYGIDSPEYDQPGSRRSKAMIKRLTKGVPLLIDIKDVDQYGRLVAIVQAGEVIVNESLVAAGETWVYDRYCVEAQFCSHLKALQSEARQQHRGIWRDQDPIPPWRWKAWKRTEREMRPKQ